MSKLIGFYIDLLKFKDGNEKKDIQFKFKKRFY